MVTCKVRKLYENTSNILNACIVCSDGCEIYFYDALPGVFCGKGLDNIQSFSQDNEIFASYMFTFDVHTGNIGSYLYMNANIHEEDAYHVLYGFMLDYIKLSSSRDDIKSANLNFRVEDMKGITLIPVTEIKSIPSDSYRRVVDGYLQRI